MMFSITRHMLQSKIYFVIDKTFQKDQNRGVNKSMSRINSAKETVPQNSVSFHQIEYCIIGEGSQISTNQKQESTFSRF